MSNLMGFGDVVLDLDRVVMVKGDMVLVNTEVAGMEWYDVGEKTADAIRSYFTPASDLGCRTSGRSQSTCDTGQEADPANSPARLSRSQQSEPVRARSLCPSCGVTSFPGQVAPAGMVAESGAGTSGTGETAETTGTPGTTETGEGKRRNFERYGSADEADEAFRQFCRTAGFCAKCRFYGGMDTNCRFAWGYAVADVEAEEAAR